MFSPPRLQLRAPDRQNNKEGTRIPGRPRHLAPARRQRETATPRHGKPVEITGWPDDPATQTFSDVRRLYPALRIPELRQAYPKAPCPALATPDRKSTRLNSSH